MQKCGSLEDVVSMFNMMHSHDMDCFLECFHIKTSEMGLATKGIGIIPNKCNVKVCSQTI
jgi:hypothetical protein